MLTETDIYEALRACYDPELSLNVVELGLVLQVSLSLDQEAPGAGIAGVPVRQRLTVELLATSDDDDRRAMLRGQVVNRLLGIEGLSRVEVTLVHEPAWTPARITPAGRKLLGLDNLVFPILNNRVR